MIIRQTAPHPEKVPYPLLRPRVNQPLKFTCLSREVFGLDTHWGNDATFHCVGSNDCHYCKQGKLARYQGYVLGRSLTNDVVAVIHLTASAAGDLTEMDRGDRGLGGLKISLSRKFETENSEVLVKLIGFDRTVSLVDDEKLSDIIHSIYRMNRVKNTV